MLPTLTGILETQEKFFPPIQEDITFLNINTFSLTVNLNSLKTYIQRLTQMKTHVHKFSSRQVHLNDFDSSNDFLTLPDSLITSTREAVFFTWQTLEMQLSQVDPVRYPEMYQALDDRAAIMFETWMQFRYVGRQC